MMAHEVGDGEWKMKMVRGQKKHVVRVEAFPTARSICVNVHVYAFHDLWLAMRELSFPLESEACKLVCACRKLFEGLC